MKIHVNIELHFGGLTIIFQALEANFLKSLGLIYAHSNMNIPLHIQIKKIVAALSSGRILQLRKNHCAIAIASYRLAELPCMRPASPLKSECSLGLILFAIDLDVFVFPRTY